MPTSLVATALSLEILLVCLLLAATGGLISLIYHAIRTKLAAHALLAGFETLLTTFTGALLANAFVAGLLWLGSDRQSATDVVGLMFFPVLSALDWLWSLLISPFERSSRGGGLITPARLTLIALVTGAAIGFFDGLRRIHRWAGLGLATFVADLTWGLALAQHAVLMHLLNLVLPGATYVGKPREGCHVYDNGVRLKADYAFTQGSVISNMSGPQGQLYAHERTHVLHSRLFGPLFWSSYMMFLLLYGALGFAVGAISKRTFPAAQEVAFAWGYLSNPWEAWAYRHNPAGRSSPTSVTRWSASFLIWPAPVVLVCTLPVLLVIFWQFAKAIERTWL